jgi:hypothetical protein
LWFISPFESGRGPLFTGGRGQVSTTQTTQAAGYGGAIGHAPLPQLTQLPSYGSVIPTQLEPVPWSITFPRDPGTGAALPNANDPILAGSRYDPFGFTLPAPQPRYVAARAAIGRYARALADSYRKRKAARDLWSRRNRLLGI